MRTRTTILLSVLLAVIPVTAFSVTRNVSISRVARGDWTYNALALLAAHGHADGLPARYFQGDHLFTRMEMAELVARIAGQPNLGPLDKVALKSLALDLRSELLAVGMTEAELKAITAISEANSPPAFTASLRGRSQSDGEDDTFSVYELGSIAPFGPNSFLTGTYTNEARDFRPNPDVFSKLDIASYKLLSQRVQFEGGRDYVRWGPGYSGSMILSDNAPAFDLARFRKDVRFPFLGKLLIDQFGSRFQEAGNSYTFLGRRYEKTFSRQWNLALNETVKTSSELNPLILVLPFYAYEQMFTDVEAEFNTLYSLDVTYTLGRKAQGYAEFLVDDMTAPRILDSNRFRRPRKTGYLLGVYLPDPLKTGRSSFRAEYILANPGTYEATRPAFPDLAYTRDGLVIGHPIGSNGNALFLRADYWLTRKTQLIVEYLDRSPRDRTASNALDFSRLDAYVAYDVRPWASLTARYVKLREGATDNVITVGASITY